MLLGQYSTGKTTFIKHLLRTSYPGAHIGPEPTTDRFVVVMVGSILSQEVSLYIHCCVHYCALVSYNCASCSLETICQYTDMTCSIYHNGMKCSVGEAVFCFLSGQFCTHV